MDIQGTRLSVRRRQATFQCPHEAAAAAATSGAAAPLAAAPLGSGVFAELPDPRALTDVAPSTVALLPEECGCPSDPFAGAGDVQVPAREAGAGCIQQGPAVLAFCIIGARKETWGKEGKLLPTPC